MAKRFTDTEKWKKKFIRSLPTNYKLLWLFITDDCDNAGIWHVDLEAAELFTGEKFDLTEATKFLGNKIVPFDNGEKWFIPSFITFQYGELCDTNRAHLSVLNKLKKYSLDSHLEEDENKPLASPLQGAKDKDKDKDTDKDKDKGKEYPQEAILLTNGLFGLMRQNDPKIREPNFEKWFEEMDKLIRIDQRTPKEIEDVIHFSQTNDFWKSNILSVKKLREKFSTLKLQMETRGKINGSTTTNTINARDKYAAVPK